MSPIENALYSAYGPRNVSNIFTPTNRYRVVIEVLRRFQRDALHEAALTRFRPIMMTTMAALMGALPISLGIAVVGDRLVSPMFALKITPVIYIYLERFQKWMRGNRPGPAALEPDRLASS